MAEEKTDSTDDTEGQGSRFPVGETEEDTEGQGSRFPVREDEDDTEGHRLA